MPCTFIRLAGCPLRCVYCDTTQALSFDSGKQQEIDDLVAQLRPEQTPLVLVTGGEPLAQKGCIPLLQSLVKAFQYVQLETSGAFDIAKVPDGVSVILDIKTPGSGEEKKNRWENIPLLKASSEIKFVLTDRSDYEWAKQVIAQYKLAEKCVVLMSCTWGSLAPKDLAEWIVADALPVRIQLQLHKYIWGSEVTGV